MSRDGAQASAMPTADLVEYAQSRVDQAFAAAAEVPVTEFEISAAPKGDLPVGCGGPFRPEVQAECIDAAYEVSDLTSTVVETRVGESTSVLTRMDAFELAEF